MHSMDADLPAPPSWGTQGQVRCVTLSPVFSILPRVLSRCLVRKHVPSSVRSLGCTVYAFSPSFSPPLVGETQIPLTFDDILRCLVTGYPATPPELSTLADSPVATVVATSARRTQYLYANALSATSQRSNLRAELTAAHAVPPQRAY